MQHKKAKHDAFQSELNAALRIRRQIEVSTPSLKEETEESEEDETDDYDDDDFEEDEPVVPSITKKSSAKSAKNFSTTWDVFKDDDDEDDDGLVGGGGSMFLKGKERQKFAKEAFDPLGMGKKLDFQKKSYLKEEQGAYDESEEDDDPIMALLRGDKSKKEKQQPTPAKRSAARKEFEGEVRSSQKQSLPSDLMVQKRTKSPVERANSPKGRKSPLASRLSPDLSHNPLVKPAETSSKSFNAQKKSLEQKRHVDSESRPKTPGSGKASPELKGILETMTSKNVPDVLSTKPGGRKKGSKEPESFVDFLLDPSQPKPTPRSKSSKASSVESESRKSPTRSLSPTPKFKEKSDPELKKRRSHLGDREKITLSGDRDKRTKSPPARPLSLQGDRQMLSSLPLPSLQPKGISLSATAMGSRGMEETTPKSLDRHALAKAEKEKVKSDADDILSLFNRSVAGENVDFQAHMQQKQDEKELKTPLEAVIHRTMEQKTHDLPRQRSSRQLLDNIIDNVAEHNDGSDLSIISTSPSESKKKTPRPKTGKKSYRTPPRNYQGLGSITMLQELKKKDGKLNETSDGSVSTDDIRKQVYLEWLAKHEEEAKKKRKEEAEKKKKEGEKKKEEKEDKEKENILVRKKWDEVKAEELKEKTREKRKEERKQKIDQEQREKLKAKNEKEAEKRRQRMLETAKIQHKAEVRKKQEEQKKKQRKEKKHKTESQKRVQEWMEDRSEQWVEDRKKEQSEKHKQERRAKKEKVKEQKEAEKKYKTWREKKDDQLKMTMRENRMKQRRHRLSIEQEDEENCRPPWSPASKVIPRHR